MPYLAVIEDIKGARTVFQLPDDITTYKDAVLHVGTLENQRLMTCYFTDEVKEVTFYSVLNEKTLGIKQLLQMAEEEEHRRHVVGDNTTEYREFLRLKTKYAKTGT